jgi:hypothetical protein
VVAAAGLVNDGTDAMSVAARRRQGSTILPFAVPAALHAWLDSPIVGGSMLVAWTKN